MHSPFVRRAAIVCLAAICCSAQTASAPDIFTSTELAFSFTPPAGMYDRTELSRQQTNTRAAVLGKKNVLGLLLALVSGPDDVAPDWYSLSIETFPRDKMSTPSDLRATEVMSRWVVGPDPTQIGKIRNEQIGTFHFMVADYQTPEGSIVKHARVYTTITRATLVSFAFGSNSSATLDPAALSMQTIRDYPPTSPPPSKPRP